MLKENRPPLRHYCDNWWKIDGESIWYLGGCDPKNPDCEVGKWYFTNEAEMFSIAYDTYAAAKSASMLAEDNLVM